MFPLSKFSFSRRAILLLAAAFALPVEWGRATVLLDETFADGTRTTQSPPTSLDWFASVSGQVTTEVGSVSILGSSTARSLVGYFTSGGYGSPQSLSIGDDLTISFDFTFTGTLGTGTGNLIRYGIYNSDGGTQFTADNADPATLVGYGGYMASINNINGTTQGFINTEIYERNTAGAARLIVNTGSYTKQASGTYQAASFTVGLTYHFEVSVSRTDSSTVQIDSEISGGDLSSPITASFTDTTSTYTAFDTIAFTSFGGASSSGSSQTTFSNIKVTLTAIPEPSALALLGLAGLGFARMRLRKK